MTKIHFEDPEMEEKPKVKKASFGKYIVLTIILSVLIGGVGGIGGILLLSSSQGKDLAKRLGITTELSIPTVETKKVVLEESSAVVDAVKKVSPAVVSIAAKSTGINIFGQTIQTGGGATGFIITSDGLILTSKHVVSDASAEYTVTDTNGKSYVAKVKSLDPIKDMAVIKIEAENLPVVEFGDSDAMEVGQWVISIGNALAQYENSATVGIISGRNRSIQATDSASGSSESLDGLFQTDAAINPGNSGGPLINLAGQVIGINTAVASDAQGIGFVIPINDAKVAIESIQKTGRIIRPYLGVRYVQVTEDIAESEKLSVNYGALVAKGQGLTNPAVISGSPADKAGIVENDIILEINGERVDKDNSLLKLVQQYSVGDNIDLKILSSGKEKTVKVTLEESK